ncbi:DNA-damage-inducible transcript 4-like protein [Salmo salar]|uniref:DNA-damage-inducible transcript 4-like protein n=1 Tax=Salmo salar TaxID=8030 RepID=C0H8H8_SALSA|nr:DNA-damage-inducible transcript 4-like protein [Salmo salar]ACN10347.1 DNA-damage-inducible transcript 4-like protein [Salmo salar]ACN12707.1 DNA-damage-inducible transcript 4-like protein [Salmo salar]|eukprot:NP_001158762.1 DNA-damage-inducible transcript 4-like protein [Salmo salar]
MVYTPALVLGHGIPIVSEEDNIVELMRKFLCQITSSDKKYVRRGSIESSEFIKEVNSSLDSETALDCEERILQQDMTRQIVCCLSEAKESSLRCRILLLPRPLTANVALDVVRSSAGEPCGLRGAFIQVYLETQLGQPLQTLGTITPDPTVTPTFELSVVFKLDKDCWPPLKHIFVTDKVLKLRPQYRLVKKKLYSSASPVIHEFC